MTFPQSYLAAAIALLSVQSVLAQQPGERKVAKVSGVDFAFRWCPPSPEASVPEGFYILETEVTQKHYEAVTGINYEQHFATAQHWDRVAKGADIPIAWLSKEELGVFCSTLSTKLKLSANGRQVRLPTESEWEYAYRAGTKADYFWDDEFEEFPTSDYVSHSGNTSSYADSVAKRKPNAWGLYDMAGNVWELVTSAENATLWYKVGGSFQTRVKATYISDEQFGESLSAKSRRDYDGQRSKITGFRVVIGKK